MFESAQLTYSIRRRSARTKEGLRIQGHSVQTPMKAAVFDDLETEGKALLVVGPPATEVRGRTKRSKAVPSALGTAFETTFTHDVRINYAGWT